MELRGTTIEDTFAEAFRMWAARLIVTARDEHWLRIAAQEATGYGTSVIGCDAEAAVERWLSPRETPDGRPGAAVLFFAFNAEKLGKSVPNRTGQCLMTCPTTAVYDGMPEAAPGDDAARLDLGKRLRFFGDGFQKSKVLLDDAGRRRRYWRVPVMDGEFVIEESCGAVKAIGGGNFLICGADQGGALDAARRAVEAIAPLPGVITPFPGGVVRSGSKVGSRYKGMFASTNDAYCPTLRSRGRSELREGVRAVYEIVINGVSQAAIAAAMRAGMEASCGEGVVAISAGNYGGNLGKFHFSLHEVMAERPPATAAGPAAAAEPRGANESASGYTLTWKGGGLRPAHGAFLRPDTLGMLDRAALAATPVRLGRRELPLGSLFDIDGVAGPTLTLRGLPPLDRFGETMRGGALMIDGDAGDDLGASMRGGTIRVRGDAGHRAGGPAPTSNRGMTGGEIFIDGRAGDFMGLRMRRGLIAVRGPAGRSPGYRMLAGTIVVGEGPLDAPGLEMRRGTIVAPPWRGPAVTGHLMEDGIFAARDFPAVELLLRRLADAAGWRESQRQGDDQFRLLSGDRLELGKGEVWQWQS